MNDVAADAGVSLKTVSRVVNGVQTVDPELTAKVLASIARLGFRRNEVAASLRSGTETKTIGLVTADLANSFYTTIASAVMRTARAHGYQVIMASSEEDPELERVLALDMCKRRVSGLIVVPTDGDHGFLKAEVDRGVPVVFVDRPARGFDADAVVLDNRGGARAAIEGVLAEGHQRIALLMDSLTIYTMRERLTGAREGLTAAGIVEDPELISTTVHSPDDAVAEIGRMLELADPPTAVLCGNNRGTIGVVEELARRSATLMIIGFDDFEMSRLLPRPVTIIDYDTAALGSLAAELLFERIDGSTIAPTSRLLPTHLVERGLQRERGRSRLD